MAWYKGYWEVVRLLKAADAGVTNIALLSEEVLIISSKLLLRGILCSCREVQRQTRVCESAAGGRAHIRFEMICGRYFNISLCYVTRIEELNSLLQC